MLVIIVLVIVSCTGLFLYFLHLFDNFIQVVPVLFTPVQLGTFFDKFLHVHMNNVHTECKNGLHFVDVNNDPYTAGLCVWSHWFT